MSSAREKVEAYWGRISFHRTSDNLWWWMIENGISSPTNYDTMKIAEEIAAEYTEQHREEVRLLEEEIAVLAPFAKGRTEESLSVMPLWAKESIPALLAEGAAINRTIQSRQQALAEKLHGTRKGATLSEAAPTDEETKG